MDAVITPRDRLSFTLFLALSLHAALILGVGFVWHAERTSTPTIEVTLAQHHDRERPDKADFIAQADQLGSGTEKDIQERTTTEEAAFHDDVFREQTIPIPQMEQTERRQSEVTLTTRSVSELESTVEEPTPESELTTEMLRDVRMLDVSEEIASIEARLDAELRENARAPRVRRLTSVSATRTVDAYYLQAWRRKVESIGNLNYPDEARRRQLYGNLRMLVSITPDGALKEVRVLESSGHKVLDDAAVRIVRLAAPYAPFPEEMRANTDVLEIIRTWQFRKNRYSSS